MNRDVLVGADPTLHQPAPRCTGVGIKIGIKPLSPEPHVTLNPLCLLAFAHPEGWQSGRMRRTGSFPMLRS
jgi:hypothetical protein